MPLEFSPGVDHGEQWELIAPSAIAHDPHYAVPRAMTKDEIRLSLDYWRNAAARALDAGFEVLEIHGAHGYLIHQFLSPAANRRTDEYGGSFDKRMRFALDVVASVRQVWPAEKPLFFRMSSVDDAGWELSHSVELARRLGAAGVDVIDCSAGGMSEASVADLAPTYGYQVGYAQDIRKSSGVRTMAVGLIVHPDQADTIIREGARTWSHSVGRCCTTPTGRWTQRRSWALRRWITCPGAMPTGWRNAQGPSRESPPPGRRALRASSNSGRGA